MANKIVLPTPYEKVFKKMAEWNKLGLNKLAGYKGSDITINLFYIYLYHKYKSKCFLSAASHKVGFRLNIGNPTKNMAFNQGELDEITRRIAKCSDHIIFIPLCFETTDIGTTHASHANMLILRKMKEGYQLEHFEPHGTAFRGKNGKKHSAEVEKWMKAFVRRLNVAFNKPVEYVSREELCPVIK